MPIDVPAIEIKCEVIKVKAKADAAGYRLVIRCDDKSEVVLFDNAGNTPLRSPLISPTGSRLQK